ncbi:MAG TPA: GntR family transcriptional regulator [Streptosporangiaceae bacterium]|nr:GntR family transcriptional regulator [Streptosporangiaceae bacterium]
MVDHPDGGRVLPGPAAQPSQGAVDRVYASLRRGILDGTYPEGARLGEMELAEALRVSRTPVREALRRLGSEGLIETLPNKGARVRIWSARELDGIFDLRALLEGHAAALAAARIADAELAVIADIVVQMEAATSPGLAPDYDLITELNGQFHGAVAAAADNPLLPEVARSFVHIPIVVRTFRLYSPERLRRSMRQHRDLLDALSAHDSAWAEAVMRTHILSARPVLAQAARENEQGRADAG